MYYDRDYLVARLEYYYAAFMATTEASIALGVRDFDTLYWDLEPCAPSFNFRDRAEQYEYNAIVRDYNARFRAEVDSKLGEKEREEREERDDADRRRRRKEEEQRREAEREAEREAKREAEREAERRREAERERRRKEQNKQNRAELARIQEQWSKQHSEAKHEKVDSILCTLCGAQNANTARFCTKCGTQLQMKCPSCGKLIRVGSKFCTACGSKIGM